MAAGTGTRLWPLSLPSRPKQFARLVDTHETLLQTTVRRALHLVDPARIFVTVGESNAHWIETQCPEVPAANVIVLPAARETLPSVALAMAILGARLPGAPVVLLASDNMVGDDVAFVGACREMVVAACASDSLVSLGVRPDHPSEAYGYMLRGEAAPFGPNSSWGAGYVEKPARAAAEAFLAGGRHDWNSGMFAWRPEVFFAAWALADPPVRRALLALETAASAGNTTETDAAFLALPNRSLDHGLMERVGAEAAAAGITQVFVTGDFPWDDVGSFDAVASYLPSDAAGNRIRGSVELRTASDCVVIAEDGWTVELDGVHDVLVAVGLDGQTLVCGTAETARLRELGTVPLHHGWPGPGRPPGADVADGNGNRADQPCRFTGCQTCTVTGAGQRRVAVVGVERLRVAVDGRAVRISADDRRAPSLMLLEEPSAVAAAVARQLVDDLLGLLPSRPSPAVVFSAGRTPAEVYRLLGDEFRDALPWSDVRFFQMDEYSGLTDDDPRRFAPWLRHHLTDRLGLQARFLSGNESVETMEALEGEIQATGGLDLVLHGIGSNGHLGFNEPGTSAEQSSGIVELAESTREDLAAAWPHLDAAPFTGVTLGLDVLNAARRVRVMALGAAKREALSRGLCQPVGVDSPFSSLQHHPELRVFADREAWSPDS